MSCLRQASGLLGLTPRIYPPTACRTLHTPAAGSKAPLGPGLTVRTQAARHKHTWGRKLSRRERILQGVAFQEQLVSVNEAEEALEPAAVAETTGAVFQFLVAAGAAEAQELGVRDTLAVLLGAGCARAQVEALFLDHAQLRRSLPAAHWTARLDLLQALGFRVGRDALPLVRACPALLTRQAEQLTASARQLLALCGTEARTRQLCLRQPALLALDADTLRDKYSDLSTLFTQTSLNKVLDLSPSLFLDDMEDITAKLDYAVNVFGAGERSVVSSRLFSHPLEHTVARCEFLLLSGVYTPPPRRGAPLTPALELRHVVDSSDARFCASVAHCAPLEFAVFRRLVARRGEVEQQRGEGQHTGALRDDVE